MTLMQVAEANGKGLIILGGQDTSRRLRTELFRLQVCLSSVNCIVCHMFMKKNFSVSMAFVDGATLGNR